MPSGHGTLRCLLPMSLRGGSHNHHNSDITATSAVPGVGGGGVVGGGGLIRSNRITPITDSAVFYGDVNTNDSVNVLPLTYKRYTSTYNYNKKK